MTTSNRLTFGTELNEALAALEDEERYHLDRLKQVREDRDCILHAGHLSLRMQTGMLHEGRGAGYGIHSHIQPQDIAHVKRIWDAYIEIALRSYGFIHARSAAQLIMAAHLTSSTNSQRFAGTVHASLKESFDFVLYSPGIYRYKPFPDWGTALPDRRPKQEPVSTASLPASPYWQKGLQIADGQDGGPD